MDAAILTMVKEAFGSRFFKFVVLLLLVGSAITFVVAQYAGIKVIFSDATTMVSDNERAFRLASQIANTAFFVVTIVAALSWVGNAIELRRLRKTQVDRLAEMDHLVDEMQAIIVGQVAIVEQMVQSMEEITNALPPDLEMHSTLSVVQHRYELVLKQYAKVQRTYATLKEIRGLGADPATTGVPAKSPL